MRAPKKQRREQNRVSRLRATMERNFRGHYRRYGFPDGLAYITSYRLIERGEIPHLDIYDSPMALDAAPQK